MCNCGKKRENYGATRSSRLGSSNPMEPIPNKIVDNVFFEYTGLSALSVTGKISGKHYRFNQPGNILPIDYRDAVAMMAVPVLRKVNTR
ncbi:MAG: hypothetical protein ABI707_04905 [Ferruginibacter sp.]